MKIKSIELYNIGLYKNEKISFKTEKKNTTIVWGNNGAGKTTLLNSIKLALFGASAFKLEYADYVKFIKESIVSSRINKNSLTAKIKCELEIDENFETHTYLLDRTYKIKNDNFDELISVYCDERLLPFEEKEEFLNKINLAIPPSLLDVIIFDGESAIDILKNDQMSKLIKNIVHSVFGIDIYYNLIKDLTLYLKNMSINDDSDNSKFDLIETENTYKNLYNESLYHHQTLSEKEKAKNNLFLQLNLQMKRLQEKTGVEFGDLLEFKQSVLNMENDRKILNNELKYIQEEILPLKIVHKKICEIINQIELEKPYLVLNNINALKDFFKDDMTAMQLINELKEKINIDADKENISLNLNEKQSSKIIEIESIISKYSKQRLLSYYEEKNESYEILKQKLEKINKLDDQSSVEIIDKIKILSDDVFNLQQQCNELSKLLNEIDKRLAIAKKDYESKRKEILQKKKKSNSYVNVLSYKESIEEFVDSMIGDICNKLNEELYFNLRSMGFRNSSITKVSISPKTFEIKLYEKDNKLIQSKLFSAGEKQILLGLMIKSSLKIAKINTFFLFDTPVGRLDVGNRSVFTKEIILKVAEQVIVFATDSDYSKADYENIKNSISQELTLKRNLKDEIIVEEESIY